MCTSLIQVIDLNQLDSAFIQGLFQAATLLPAFEKDATVSCKLDADTGRFVR